MPAPASGQSGQNSGGESVKGILMAPILAYIDPSSGMIAVQVFFAAIAGGILYCRRAIANIFRKVFGK